MECAVAPARQARVLSMPDEGQLVLLPFAASLLYQLDFLSLPLGCAPGVVAGVPRLARRVAAEIAPSRSHDRRLQVGRTNPTTESTMITTAVSRVG